MNQTKYTARREEGLTPNGNEIGGRWVVRDRDGNFVDVDKYRNDLASRYHGKIEFVGE